MGAFSIRGFVRFLLPSFVVVAAASGAQAGRTVRLLDFDGTIVDDQSATSTWRTDWILARIDRMHSAMQVVPAQEAAPPTLSVSYRDYLRYANRLGRDGMINSLTPVPLDPDPVFRGRPRSFVPGWYQIDDSITFKRYEPTPRGTDYLVQDWQNAELRTRYMNASGSLPGPAPYDWRGPGFSLFHAGMSDPSTVGDTKIFTRRDPTDAGGQRLLDAWAAGGVIGHSRGVDGLGGATTVKWHSLVGGPESVLFSHGSRHLAADKAQVVQDEATALLHGPHDGTPGPHTLIAGEDDPANVDAVARIMAELSASGDFAYGITFVLLNASSDEAFKTARHRFRYSVFERGRARGATAEEIASWTAPVRARPSSSLRPACGGLFRFVRGQP